MPNQANDPAATPAPAPDGAALLIIDMINDMAFEGAEGMREAAPAVTDAILRLRAEADTRGMPVVYVNDNHGQWRSERTGIVEHCLRDDSPARDLVARIQPRERDYFVIKPQFSGFYSTNLPVLLPKLGATRLILTGVAADICVLFTAADAHMRDYALWAPSDAVASNDRQHTDWALEIMRMSMQAETRPSRDLGMADWIDAHPRRKVA